MGDLIARLRQLFFLTALMAMIPLAVTAAEWHRLAYSKALSIEIFAKIIDRDWCKSTLRLRLVSDDASIFRKAELRTLLRKLGVVIEQECPAASIALLVGISRSTGEQVFGGSASRVDEWALKETPPTPEIAGSQSNRDTRHPFKLGQPNKPSSSNAREEKAVQRPYDQRRISETTVSGSSSQVGISPLIAGLILIGGTILFFIGRSLRLKTHLAKSKDSSNDANGSIKEEPSAQAIAAGNLTPQVRSNPATPPHNEIVFENESETQNSPSFSIASAQQSETSESVEEKIRSGGSEDVEVSYGATEMISSHTKKGTSTMKIVGNVALFVIVYIVFMIPTYLLPYLGSNSSVVTATGLATGAGINPSLLLHLGALAVLVVMTWFRGALIGKKWLVIFPILATAFDILPVLNIILMIPTVMHLCAIILGVVGSQNVVQVNQQVSEH